MAGQEAMVFFLDVTPWLCVNSKLVFRAARAAKSPQNNECANNSSYQKYDVEDVLLFMWESIFLAMRGDANQKYYSGDELVATCDPVTIRE